MHKSCLRLRLPVEMRPSITGLHLASLSKHPLSGALSNTPAHTGTHTNVHAGDHANQAAERTQREGARNEGAREGGRKSAADRARELGRDLLRLVGDAELRNFDGGVVGLQQASQQADEGGFAGPVLSQHHDDLAVRESALLDRQREVALRLGHVRIAVVRESLHLLVDLPALLRHLRVAPSMHPRASPHGPVFG